MSSDSIEDVFNYLNKVEEDTICFVNSCAPLLNIFTLKKAVDLYHNLELKKSLTTVVENKTWYFDDKNRPLNDNSSGNTKDLLCHYMSARIIFIYFIKKNFLLIIKKVGKMKLMILIYLNCN